MIFSKFRQTFHRFISPSSKSCLRRNLLELRRCLQENQDELQAALKKDLNKGFIDFYWSEMNHVYQEIQDCLDHLHTFTNEERKPTDWINMLNWTSSCVRYDPYGVEEKIENKLF